MKKHISFTKIKQFRDTIRNVKHQTYFDGVDENGDPIYNKNRTLPTITFIGTTKLHGSNGSMCLSKEGEFWCQSRKRILSIERDNYDFSQFCNQRKDSFLEMFEEIKKQVNNFEILCIFGEYCGEGIQNGVAISQLPKMFVIFAVKVVPMEGDSYYINCSGLRSIPDRIYNINDFKTFSVDVDFNHPEIAQNKFVKYVQEVEEQCPVGKELGACGIGEGIVWVADYEGIGHSMKTKGSKHSVSRVRKIAKVDIEKVNNIKEFVEYACTENRMQQAVDELFTSQNEEPTIQKMGDFLRWLMKDISEEEADTMKENNLLLKDVGRHIANKARPWFQELLDKNVGL